MSDKTAYEVEAELHSFLTSAPGWRWYPLPRKMCGPQSLSGPCGQGISFSCRNPTAIQAGGWSLY